jgi:hypothetical protein
MPKLQNKKPPKYCKLNNYAVVYQNGKPIYLGGLYGSPESKEAYARYIAETQVNLTFSMPKGGEKGVTVKELVAAFLDYAKTTVAPTDYAHYQVIILDFRDKLYGNIAADEFKPSWSSRRGTT